MYVNTIKRVQQSLAHNEDLFRKKTWTNKTATCIKLVQLQTPLLARAPNVSHPDYKYKPPWQESTLCFSVTTLTNRKASFITAALTQQFQHTLAAVKDENAEVYFTGGSVDPDTHGAAAAFLHIQETGHFRLPDHSSALQTEFVAIEKTLEHAKPRNKHDIIHTDFLGTIQCPAQEHITDNIHFITSNPVSAQRVQELAKKVTLNSFPAIL